MVHKTTIKKSSTPKKKAFIGPLKPTKMDRLNKLVFKLERAIKREAPKLSRKLFGTKITPAQLAAQNKNIKASATKSRKLEAAILRNSDKRRRAKKTISRTKKK